jgi:hypothetical protein
MGRLGRSEASVFASTIALKASQPRIRKAEPAKRIQPNVWSLPTSLGHAHAAETPSAVRPYACSLLT